MAKAEPFSHQNLLGLDRKGEGTAGAQGQPSKLPNAEWLFRSNFGPPSLTRLPALDHAARLKSSQQSNVNRANID